MSWFRSTSLAVGLLAGAALLGWWSLRPAAGQSVERTSRTFAVTARRYAFSPARIEVTEGDIVTIDLKTDDIPHSLTIDAYRLSKRVNPGQPVSFEFRADHAGTFPFYCNLQIDEGCRQMRGELVVRPR